MPDFLIADLKRFAAKKGKSGKDADRYVYGAMNDMGVMRGNKETAKGREWDKKHAEKVARGK